MQPAEHLPEGDARRRRALIFFVNTVVAFIGGGLTALAGVFALRPQRTGNSERWIRVGAVSDLKPNVPVPRVITVSRVDGWYRERARETVFLVWDGDANVRAMSAPCTHLGCQVHWEADAKRFKCPCHGGAYDREGRVVAGPPPAPLQRYAVRVNPQTSEIEVEL